FTRDGTYILKNTSYKADFGPMEAGCDCFACRHYTRAYLRHLLNVGEIVGLRMLSIHNTHMYVKLMSDIRQAIAAGTFVEFHRDLIARYRPTQKILLARAAAGER